MKEWLIPSKEELDYMASVLRPTQVSWETRYNTPVIEFDGIWEKDRYIYRFSAAAAAVQFLSRHRECCVHLRRIILDEDREAVAFPECHGKGLVPFCVENPRLRIERRVNLWNNLFPMISRISKIRAWQLRMQSFGPGQRRIRREAEERYRGFVSDRGISTRWLSLDVSRWVREAAALPSGISLVFDGDPAPEQASTIFERVVVQQAIWQNALEESFVRGLLRNPGPVYSSDWWRWHITEFPEAEGVVCDGEHVIWTNRHWTPDDLEQNNLKQRSNVYFQTAPPLPEFPVILKEDVLPPADA